MKEVSLRLSLSGRLPLHHTGGQSLSSENTTAPTPMCAHQQTKIESICADAKLDCLSRLSVTYSSLQSALTLSEMLSKQT